MTAMARDFLSHLPFVGKRFAAPEPAPAPEPYIFIGEERSFDVAGREALLDLAFGAERGTKSSELLRAGRLPAEGLSLVARDNGRVVGTVRLWHVDAGGAPALMLGPLAVAPSHRSLGVGGKLMREALRRAAERGFKAILLVGDEPYYRRFGFKASLTAALEWPGKVDRARFLAFEIEPGALRAARGKVRPTGAVPLRAARREGLVRKAS